MAQSTTSSGCARRRSDETVPHLIRGAIQHYDWGDTDFIPDLIGHDRDGSPWAEMWLGTHPSAPSALAADGETPLSSVTGDMTMLVKILACSSPLSLQTHPTLAQARRGFAREESAGIARNDPARLYRDESDKPEMLVAFTPFEALCGFSPLEESLEFLGSLGWSEEVDILEGNGLDGYLLWAFDQTTTPDTAHAPDWLRRIAHAYPHDCGLRVAPLLNHVYLSPGEALALPAGNLHAYLHGAGLEVMKCSDNVVRAGFTSKKVDVAELLRIVDTATLTDPIARPIVEGQWLRYPSPSDSFDVANWTWQAGDSLPVSDKLRVVLGDHGLTARQSSFVAYVVLPGETLTASSDDDSPANGSWWVCTQN